ncbi:hypothetical protein [Nostoc sp. UHCC 0252]|uniref:hypothetical protein n=1 Tax=Nostoc sp. UHCC 0252 TaxID=3110241 RepID=UPI002B1F63B4|nr:hypothetical protein [Nostoc sp. UHCC 0252]MEA5601078.1 hypothetical protein [Nostoc sp. UHCC 0252]
MLNDILGLTIITNQGMPEGESLRLIEKLECAELAQQHFIKGLISLSDYLDILDLCEVNVDDYLVTVEQNLAAVGAI